MITVKEGVIAAAEVLGFGERVKAYLDGESQDGKTETEALIRCFSTVENELALDYFPLTAEETLQTQTGAVYFSEFSRSAVRVLKITDEWGNSVPFKLYPDYLKAQSGLLHIVYCYTPQEKSIQDSSDFTLFVSVRHFAYGMAAEYALSVGLFEEAAVFSKKYKDAIAASYRLSPSKKIRARRWV